MTPSDQSYSQISIGQGIFTLVDEKDAEFLGKFHWRPFRRRGKASIYAATGRCFMHRIILGLCPRDGKIADHINGDTLDNRRCNLRILTASQSNHNRNRPKHSKMPFRGVSKSGKKWGARIYVDKKAIYLGTFDTAEQAHAAYANAADFLVGPFTRKT